MLALTEAGDYFARQTRVSGRGPSPPSPSEGECAYGPAEILTTLTGIRPCLLPNECSDVSAPGRVIPLPSVAIGRPRRASRVGGNISHTKCTKCMCMVMDALRAPCVWCVWSGHVRSCFCVVCCVVVHARVARFLRRNPVLTHMYRRQSTALSFPRGAPKCKLALSVGIGQGSAPGGPGVSTPVGELVRMQN